MRKEQISDALNLLDDAILEETDRLRNREGRKGPEVCGNGLPQRPVFCWRHAWDGLSWNKNRISRARTPRSTRPMTQRGDRNPAHRRQGAPQGFPCFP